MIWNITTGTKVKKIYKTDVNVIKQIDSERFLTGNQDGKIYIYNMTTYELIRTLNGHSTALVSFETLHNGLLMSISLNQIVWWNMSTYNQVQSFSANLFDPTTTLSRIRELASDGTMIVGFAYSYSLYKYRLYANGSVGKLHTLDNVNPGAELFEMYVVDNSTIVFNSWDHVRVINKSNDELVFDFSTRNDYSNIRSLEVISSNFSLFFTLT